ncbi:hypothetical protein Focb16_v001761 [Fusarium oxysporum f. sp. cubense]|uniref:C2H2-type domain-containing protein n=1 Tax=Fusarium oxysporum f. sp. cubense TaxID=61366 RepID=A0A559LAU3_FUSOC|nr:hypothetical protein Focb16_v001761 [Fusarium oxysporum f. sp. cubense]
MVLHLEANTCESGSDRDSIREWVWDYYEIHGHWNHDHDDDFGCESCGAYFNMLSALLQHVESRASKVSAACDRVAYGAAQKQPTSVPNTAVQQYQYPIGPDSSESAAHAPRQFPDYGEDASGAAGAQNINRTIAMVEEQVFLLTACWTLHCMPCRMVFNDASEQATHNSNWHWDRFLCFACDIGFETALDLKKVSPQSPPSNSMSNLVCPPSIYHHIA